MRIATGKLDFGDNGDIPLAQSHNHGGILGNARTLDYLVGIQYQLGGMVTLFPRNTVVVELLFI